MENLSSVSAVSVFLAFHYTCSITALAMEITRELILAALARAVQAALTCRNR